MSNEKSEKKLWTGATDTKNFKVKEFECHCGCGYNQVHPVLMQLCQKIRDAVDIPVRVNSGCRCSKRNAAVGGKPHSYHLKGLAADLSCSVGAPVLWAAVKDLWVEGEIPELKWCCFYPKRNFIHVDIGKDRKEQFAVNYN
ncbi:MAG: hypothetical protein IJS40_05105 [Synergistaceae bacterium]|nr:hypothetical protein [Synergistaceae bacterium]